MKKKIKKKKIKDVEQVINDAVKEGFLDEDTAREMTSDERYSYYWECQLKEPDKD